MWWFAAGRLTDTRRESMSNNMAKIADARKTVEQLKLEVNIERMMVSLHIMRIQNINGKVKLSMGTCLVFLRRMIMLIWTWVRMSTTIPTTAVFEESKTSPPVAQVSTAAADLMAYCEAHAKEDPLVTAVPSSENPFREKKLFCVIL